MAIFLCSSGHISHKISELLKHVLSQLFPTTDIFYSIDDIQKGTEWISYLEERLVDTDLGIICLTESNIVSPWIMYEENRLSSQTNHVISLLIDVNANELKDTPLSKLEHAKLTKEGFIKLVNYINNNLPEHEKQRDSLLINSKLNVVWQFIQNELENILDNKPIRIIKTSNVNSLLLKDKIIDAVKEVTKKRQPPVDERKVVKQN